MIKVQNFQDFTPMMWNCANINCNWFSITQFLWSKWQTSCQVLYFY